jgi:hypothetical protein
MNQVAAALISLAGAHLAAVSNDMHNGALGQSLLVGGAILFLVPYLATSYVGFTRWRKETNKDA